MKIGVKVTCPECGNPKKPVGRDEPPGGHMFLCVVDVCNGWWKPPYPGSLWPGEKEFDFGFPISEHGVREEKTIEREVTRQYQRPESPLGVLWRDQGGAWIVQIRGLGDYTLRRYTKKGDARYIKTENGAISAVAELMKFVEFVTV